jgi:putative aldouronate transport system substrate-binding protein
MNRKFRPYALRLSVVLIAALLGACSPAGTTTTTPAKTAAATAAAATPAPATAAPTEAASADNLLYPFEKTLKVTYWQQFSPKYSATISSFDELPYFQWVEEQLNIDFVWTEPPEDTAKEQFGLMIASNDWPDIIQGFNPYYAAAFPPAMTTASSFRSTTIWKTICPTCTSSSPNSRLGKRRRYTRAVFSLPSLISATTPTCSTRASCCARICLTPTV